MPRWQHPGTCWAGSSGYLSLGHAAFFGVGAYAEAIVFTHIGIGGGYRPFAVLPLIGLGVAVAAIPIAIVFPARARRHLRDRDDLVAVHRAAARVQPALAHKRRAGHVDGHPTVSGCDVRAPVLRRDAGGVPGGSVLSCWICVSHRKAGVDAIRHPRRRGPRARARRPGHRRQGDRLLRQRRAVRDAGRDLGLLRGLHLPAVCRSTRWSRSAPC